MFSGLLILYCLFTNVIDVLPHTYHLIAESQFNHLLKERIFPIHSAHRITGDSMCERTL
jgi:hypothetical protein